MLFLQGIIDLKQEDYDSSIAKNTLCLAMSPEYFYAYNNRACCYIEKEECEKALNDLNKSLKINPDFYESYMNRGICFGAE